MIGFHTKVDLVEKNSYRTVENLQRISNALQLYVSMRYEATFLERTIFKDSLTPEQPVIHDVVQRRERKDQDIIPHVPPGPDGISLISRSISRQRRTAMRCWQSIPHLFRLSSSCYLLILLLSLIWNILPTSGLDCAKAKRDWLTYRYKVMVTGVVASSYNQPVCLIPEGNSCCDKQMEMDIFAVGERELSTSLASWLIPVVEQMESDSVALDWYIRLFTLYSYVRPLNDRLRESIMFLSPFQTWDLLVVYHSQLGTFGRFYCPSFAVICKPVEDK
ncbi:hypothetical protein ACTXT7_005490 [Hymenolepis weldensis]